MASALQKPDRRAALIRSQSDLNNFFTIVGYLVLLGALYLPALARYQQIVRWLLILFAAVTIVMYFAIVGFRFNPIGLFDKAVEVALIALLLIEGRQSQRSTIDAAPA